MKSLAKLARLLTEAGLLTCGQLGHKLKNGAQVDYKLNRSDFISSWDEVRASTSGQVVLKLIVANLATIFGGPFAINFWPSWPEVNGVQVGHHFYVRNFCPSWAEVKTWTMMVHVLYARNFRP